MYSNTSRTSIKKVPITRQAPFLKLFSNLIPHSLKEKRLKIVKMEKPMSNGWKNYVVYCKEEQSHFTSQKTTMWVNLVPNDI